MKSGFPFFLLLVLTAASISRAAVPVAEKLLTEDTLAVVTVPDVRGLVGFFERSSMGQFWGDPALRPFKDKFMTKFRSDVVDRLEREFGVKFSDYTGLAQGQLTVALTRSGWDGSAGQRPGFLVLMDAGDKSDELKKQLELLKTKWVGAGKKLRSERIRDVEFTTLMFSVTDLDQVFTKALSGKGGAAEDPDGAGEGDGDKGELKWTVGQSGSLFILGDHATDIEKVMILQSGGAIPSLAENPVFALNQAGLFRESRTYAWVDLRTLISIGSKSIAGGAGGGSGLGAFNAEKLLEPLGLNGLQSLAWSLKGDRDGSLVDFLVSVPESKRKGIFKLLAFEALEAGPPDFVAADAMKFSRFRLDLVKLWNGLETLLGEINPQLAGVLKLLVDTAGKDQDPNFDLRENLLGNLGDDIIVVEKEPATLNLQALTDRPVLILMGSQQPKQLATALRSMSGVLPATGPRPKERDFLGRTIHSIPLPSAGGEGDAASRSLHFSASGGYVALSTDVALLESYLRSAGDTVKPLRVRAGLADAAERVGGMSSGLFGYEDQAKVMEITLGALKKESGNLSALFGNSPLAGGLGAGQETLNDWFDFSLLPDFERVSKYFYFSVYGGRVTAEGFRFKFFAPEPPNRQ